MRPKILAVALLLAGGCALFQSTSRVRDGELYRSGVEGYDFYFNLVHELQQTVPRWADESRTARKALVDELNVPESTPESTIAQLTHEKVEAKLAGIGLTRIEVNNDDAKVTTAKSRGDSETSHFLGALEAMAKSELAFAKRMRGVQPKIEALLKSGHDLEARVQEEFGKYSNMKASEVKGELAASFDVLDKISSAASHTARDAEYFIADLQRAVAATGIGSAPIVVPTPTASAASSVAIAATTAKPAGVQPVTRPYVPVARPTTAANVPAHTTGTSPPPPPPPPAGGEVFNP